MTPREHDGRSGAIIAARVGGPFRDNFLAHIRAPLDPCGHGRRSRIVDQMLVCSAKPRCRCLDHEPDPLDQFTCECATPTEYRVAPPTRREHRHPRCMRCGAPLHGVRS